MLASTTSRRFVSAYFVGSHGYIRCTVLGTRGYGLIVCRPDIGGEWFVFRFYDKSWRGRKLGVIGNE